jgi:type IV secretion system protein TrbB
MSTPNTHAQMHDGIPAAHRRIELLRSVMGPVITNALTDREVVEVILNPDGALWVHRVRSGSEPLGVKLSPMEGEHIIRAIAAHMNMEIDARKPLLSVELADSGEQFNAALPPAVPGPAFCIHKYAAGVIDLHDHVSRGILSASQASFLRSCVHQKKNILISGGTGTDKIPLANALLLEIASTSDRVVTLEDASALKSPSLSHVSMRPCAGAVTMREVACNALRHLPDRVVITEIRAGEALDIVRAWGTRAPGGIATIHSASAHGALVRLEELIREVTSEVTRQFIADTINVVVFLSGRGRISRVAEIACVAGLAGDGYAFDSSLGAECMDVSRM